MDENKLDLNGHNVFAAEMDLTLATDCRGIFEHEILDSALDEALEYIKTGNGDSYLVIKITNNVNQS